MEELSKSFPQGLEYRIVYNPTVFVRESINAVIHTLFEAVGAGRDRGARLPAELARQPDPAARHSGVARSAPSPPWRRFGFSLNMLSLFGLVLAIGIVVDDAIVVVENVERHIADGPLAARGRAQGDGRGDRRGHRDRVRALGGVRADGLPRRHLRPVLPPVRAHDRRLDDALGVQLADAEPGDVRAAAPAARRRRRTGSGGSGTALFGRFFAAFNRGFDRLSDALRARRRLARPPRRASGSPSTSSCSALTVFGFRTVPTGFIPAQDKGYLIVAIQLPDGASLERTDAVVRRASEIILGTPGVSYAVAFAGFSGATRANSVERRRDLRRPEAVRGARATGRRRDELLADAAAAARPRSRTPTSSSSRRRRCSGLGTVGRLQAPRAGPRRARAAARCRRRPTRYVDAARRDPDVCAASSPPSAPATPQLYADVDRVKAQKLERAARQRLRHAPGLSRLGLRERLQPLRPHLPGARAGRGRLPRRARGHRARSRRATPRASMVPLGSVARRRSGAAAPIASCATTCSPPPRSTATPRRAAAQGTAHRRRWSASPRRCCRPACRSSGPTSPTRSSSPATPRSSSSRSACCSCSWCTRPSTRAGRCRSRSS